MIYLRFVPAPLLICACPFSHDIVLPEDLKVCICPARSRCVQLSDMQLARRQGDFLLVGLHTDEDVGDRRGVHLPIMDLHERSLSVLACRYINEVIIGESRLDYSAHLLQLLPCYGAVKRQIRPAVLSCADMS